MATSTARPNGTSDDNGTPRLSPFSLLVVLIVFAIILNLGSLVVTVMMAVLLGTVLEGPVQRFQKRGVPRAAAIAFCYIGVLAVIVALVFVIIPVVQNQAADFRETFPEQLHELRDDWAGSSNALLNGTGVSLLDSGLEILEDPEPAPSVSGETAAAAIPILGTVIAALASLITTLVITFYYLLEKKLVRRVVIAQLSPGVQTRVDRLWTLVETKVGGWLRGQLMLCLIIGTIATVSYGIIGLEFWPLLGLWAGITEIIPIVGPWIGGIPAVIVALTMGPDKALIVAIIIILMQSLENWFLVPRVMRGAVGLSPLTVFVAIVAGTQLMGVVGAVLAIPVAAGLQVVLTDLMKERRAGFEAEREQGSGWRWMLNRARVGETHAEAEEDDLFGTQVESDVSMADEDTTNVFDDSDGDGDIEFKEAPRMLVDAERFGTDTARASESTWPSNPWRAHGTGPRESSPWKAAYRPSQKSTDDSGDN